MQYKIDLIFSLRTCKIDIRFTYGKKKEQSTDTSKCIKYIYFDTYLLLNVNESNLNINNYIYKYILYINLFVNIYIRYNNYYI